MSVLSALQKPAARCSAGQGSRPTRAAAVRPVAASQSDQAAPSYAGAQAPGLLQRAALSLLSAVVAAVPLTALPAVLPAPPPAAHALLTAGDPIKNAQAILRYALPIDCKPIRQVQKDLESISDALRIPGSKSLGPISRAVRSATGTLTSQRAAILAAVAPAKTADGDAALAQLDRALAEFSALIEAKDKQAVPIKQRECLDYVGRLEEAMVAKFPFEIPAEYSARPLLKGRATLEMKVALSETPEGPRPAVLTVVLDGYNAPVSAGQFLDLVERGFYDGMDVQRADGFVVQTGDPEGPADGFVDAKGDVVRVPMEIRVAGDKDPVPVYEINLEDLGRFNEQPVLPFNAYGTLAWARGEFDNNSASSQVFFLLKESELTPSGANLLDGRYAVFGYAVEGQDALGLMRVGDKIEYIKVLSGAENLVNGFK